MAAGVPPCRLYLTDIQRKETTNVIRFPKSALARAKSQGLRFTAESRG